MRMDLTTIKRLLDLLVPRHCACCGQRLSGNVVTLCSNCNRSLPRTYYLQTPLDNEMARHFWGKFPILRAASLFFYMPGSDTAALVKDMKYHNQPSLAQDMGYFLAEESLPTGFFEGVDLLVPVPLTKRRERQRGYNQSYELAVGIRRATGISIGRKVLRRVHFAESQTEKSGVQRTENVENAFVLDRPEEVRGRHILLVDDIVTTGATIAACGRELAKAGDVTVSVLSLCFTKV